MNKHPATEHHTNAAEHHRRAAEHHENAAPASGEEGKHEGKLLASCNCRTVMKSMRIN
jgi:hypothetical protein